MKTRFFLLTAFLSFLTAFTAASLEAKTLENGTNDRRGFFLGLGLGGGILNLSGEGESETKAAFLADIKIGGGIKENILLMYNGNVSFTQFDDVDFQVFSDSVAAQFFFDDNFYLRPGVGITYARASASSEGFSISADSDVSFGAHLAGGYEFRLGKYFSLSPELVYRYSHIRSDAGNAHANVIGAQACLLWYF